MYKGFYTLTSGMLSQQRNLNVVSNNMVNFSTPGFKKDTFLSGTFQEEMLSRVGNKNRANPTQMGTTTSMMRAPQETVTNFTQGGFLETEQPLDFALSQNGFFQVQTDNGLIYTRNGSFEIDDEGYLNLPRMGRVLGTNGPIQFNSDDIMVNEEGTILENNGNGYVPVDNFAIVDFADYATLAKVGEGMFQSNAQANNVQSAVVWKTLERSNVEPMEEMSVMLQSQRALQSASQVLKMYDQLLSKATTEIGRVQ